MRSIREVASASRAAHAERARQAVNRESGIPFLRVQLELHGRNYTRDLEVEARVDMDPEGLSRALADLPGLFAFYAAAEAEARAVAKLAELERAKIHAERYTFLESSHAVTDAKGKRSKPTVEAIKSLIVKDPRYHAAQIATINAERQLDLTVAARQTIQVKKDVTLAAASNYRAELDAQFHSALKTIRDRRPLPQGGAE
jgi:hypothetical protein